MAENPSSPVGYVHSLETFGSVDGPGVRFLIFLAGCPMRCQYCHNADTWQMQTGTPHTADELLSRALRYRSYWGREGGITVSGGEPLLQMDFLLDLFAKAKAQGVHTTLDTSGILFTRQQPEFSRIEQLMRLTDLVLLDLKHIDDAAHRILTGHGNAPVLDFARYLSDIGKPIWVRHVLVPQRTDDDTALYLLADFLSTLNNVQRIEVLPYHTLGAYKWKALGLDYPLEGIAPPSRERIDNARRILGAL